MYQALGIVGAIAVIVVLVRVVRQMDKEAELRRIDEEYEAMRNAIPDSPAPSAQYRNRIAKFYKEQHN